MKYDFTWIKKQKVLINNTVLSEQLSRQAMAYIMKYDEVNILGKMLSLCNIRKLILDGADVNYAFINGETLLSKACKIKNSENLVKLLVEARADVNYFNTDGITPLISACKSGESNSATILLDNGADVDYISTEGSAIGFAYKNKMYDIVHRILMMSADCQNKDHLSVLSDVFNFEQNNTKLPCYDEFQQNIIKDMMSIKGALDAKDIGNNTFLHKSITNKNYYLACELLKAGVNPNLQNNDGDTPLHILFKQKYDESWTMIMTRLLLDVGTKVDIKNKNNQTVIDICPDDTRFLVILEDAKQNIKSDKNFFELTFASKPFEKMFYDESLFKDLKEKNISIKQYQHNKKKEAEELRVLETENKNIVL